MITEYFLRINEEFYESQNPWKKKEIQQFRKNIIMKKNIHYFKQLKSIDDKINRLKKEIQQFRKNIIKLKLEKSRLKKPKENDEQYEIFK